ncbi:flavin reductase family protein [Streptomyces sp. NL15-2K]|uniref:flavin reductase family protein n=1 Tax=Streptomyces sp. NL15-2K TaxID=376149 RepID=UPI000F5685F9|nr:MULTISPECIES: flavin reductase family protein [Actinomycetes]WKX15177.1 flavin reductase family protein [Kutzneria buriramensis]GCB52269.1 NADH-FMN oxidoreductase [Streptomyces sp. NL15-2K]
MPDPAMDHAVTPRPVTSPGDDPHTYRDGLSSMVTSVCVVTTEVDGIRYGFTANTVTSVSMDPPLISVCLADTADVHPAFSQAESVAVNVLAADQRPVANAFGAGATSGPGRFAAAPFGLGKLGQPLLDGATVSFEGAVHQRLTAGDHTIILIEVAGVVVGEREPLTYQGRRFHTLNPVEPSTPQPAGKDPS